VSEDSALPKKTVTYFSWYMKLAGYSKMSTTLDVYSHVSLELQKQVAAQLNVALIEGR